MSLDVVARREITDPPIYPTPLSNPQPIILMAELLRLNHTWKLQNNNNNNNNNVRV